MKRFRQRVYEIVAEPPPGDRLGNFVNFFILGLIAVNVIVGIFETIHSLHAQFPAFFYWFEAVSVIIFTVEYVVRMWACTSQEKYHHPLKGRMKLALTPMAVIDLLAILPFYIQMILPAGIDLRFIRILRLFRLFRMFRMGRLMKAFTTLSLVFRRKKEELSIAIVVLGIVVVFAASLMYLAEGKVPGTKFTSIPASMWWAIITVTTIGYGDMFPVTPVGQILGAFIGFAGVCVFALPVAILGAGFIEEVDPEFQLHPSSSADKTTSQASEQNAMAAPGTEPPGTEPPGTAPQEQPNTMKAPDTIPSTTAKALSQAVTTAHPVTPPVSSLPTSALAPGATETPAPAQLPYDDALLDAIAARVAARLADQVAERVVALLNKDNSSEFRVPSSE